MLRRRVPGYERIYDELGWKVPADIDRIYVNEPARRTLGREPLHNFEHILDRLRRGEDYRSALTRSIGSKGYRLETFMDRPYPVDWPQPIPSFNSKRKVHVVKT